MEESNAFIILKEFVSLAYHLMLVYELLSSPRSPDEIEAAILAAASLAALGRDDVAQRIERNRIARHLLYPTDVVSLGDDFAALDNHRIDEDDDVASPEIIAVHPIHYHPVALFQLGRQTSLGHREDSESKCAHSPSQEQG